MSQRLAKLEGIIDALEQRLDLRHAVYTVRVDGKGVRDEQRFERDYGFPTAGLPRGGVLVERRTFTRSDERHVLDDLKREHAKLERLIAAEAKKMEALHETDIATRARTADKQSVVNASNANGISP